MQSPLLGRLPTELRNEIYELALQHSDTIRIAVYKKPLKKSCPVFTPVEERFGGLRGTLALTKTCREIRHESLPVVFASNGFVFVTNELSSCRVMADRPRYANRIHEWLGQLGAPCRSLRNVEVHLGSWVQQIQNFSAEELIGVIREYQDGFHGTSARVTFSSEVDCAATIKLPLHDLTSAKRIAQDPLREMVDTERSLARQMLFDMWQIRTVEASKERYKEVLVPLVEMFERAIR